jgi:hypothetical protein
MPVEIIRVPKSPAVTLDSGQLKSGLDVDRSIAQQLEADGFTMLNPRRSARLAEGQERKSVTGALEPPGTYGWMYFKNTALEKKIKEAQAKVRAQRKADKASAMDSSYENATTSASKPTDVKVPETEEQEDALVNELSAMFSGKVGFGPKPPASNTEMLEGGRRRRPTRKSRKTRHRRTRRRFTRA